MTHPKGIGFYGRELSTSSHGTPKGFADKLVAAKASYVVLLACWQDKINGTPRQQNQNTDRTLQYANAARAAGIDVWIWGFPWLNREHEYFDQLDAVLEAGKGLFTGVVHDPEVSYRNRLAKKATGKGQAEANHTFVAEGTSVQVFTGATVLIDLDADLVKKHGIAPSGITSYGIADWHPLAWSALSRLGAWGSPQLYSVTPRQVDQGIEQWRKNGFKTIIPSVPLFGMNSAGKLGQYLGAFVDGTENVDGFIFWSFQQMSAYEQKVIAKFSEEFAARACLP
jgi:hypothetical protein